LEVIGATLSGIEMGLPLAGAPHAPGGVAAAIRFLTHWKAQQNQ
jgi:hypothetical protein